MRRLLNGILEFKKSIRPDYAAHFESLAGGQAPEALFIGCSDSRVVPHLLANAEPGDLFVMRNVGALMPEGHVHSGASYSDESEAAALEYAVDVLNVPDVVVCGHSGCGAMKAILGGRENVQATNLASWLRHGDGAHKRLKAGEVLDPTLPPVDQLSQLSVLEQVAHCMTYPNVRRAVEGGRLRIHAWWFNVGPADMHIYDEEDHCFHVLTPEYAVRAIANSVGH